MRKLPNAVALSRNLERAARQLGSAEIHRWDPNDEPAPLSALQGAEVVINLAGEPVVEGRWNKEKKQRILDSRVVGTQNLVAGLEKMDTRPRVLISASAVGYYGACGDEELYESNAPGTDFLSQVCIEWEQAAHRAEALGIRVVCVRLGLVLAADGGALGRMLLPFKMGAGGRLGSGKQWMPWIHINDLVGMIVHAAEHPEIRGPVNAVAPNPVTNADFTRALGRAVRRPALFPVPQAALKVVFGEVANIMMASQRALPRAALEHGYSFQYTELDQALHALIRNDAATSSP